MDPSAQLVDLLDACARGCNRSDPFLAAAIAVAVAIAIAIAAASLQEIGRAFFAPNSSSAVHQHRLSLEPPALRGVVDEALPLLRGFHPGIHGAAKPADVVLVAVATVDDNELVARGLEGNFSPTFGLQVDTALLDCCVAKKGEAGGVRDVDVVPRFSCFIFCLGREGGREEGRKGGGRTGGISSRCGSRKKGGRKGGRRKENGGHIEPVRQ